MAASIYDMCDTENNINEIKQKNKYIQLLIVPMEDNWFYESDILK